MDEFLFERTVWFVRLRWFAALGLIAAPTLAALVFDIEIHATELYILAFAVALYNLIYLLLIKRESRNVSKISVKKLQWFANIQISIDLIALTMILHYSAGIENPFMFFFIFHIVISGVILSRKLAFAQTTLAAVLFLGMVILEYHHILDHHPMYGFPTNGLYLEPLYITTISIIFLSTAYISVYFVSSLSYRFKEANALLKDKDRIKSEYVLRVSHDIKGHLAAVHSTIEPVVKELVGPLNEKQKNLLNRTSDRTDKLLTFVKSLLNLTITKLKEGSATVAFDFNEMMNVLIDLVLPDAAEKAISLTLKMDEKKIICEGSKAEIQATILEIISNAVKYTPEKGIILVTAIKKSYSVHLSISDTGVGIPEKEIHQVFNEFYRSSNAKTEDGSSGLGLAMAKHVIEKHGGKIRVDSEIGKGTTFYIELPVI